MSRARRRYYRTILLGVVAMGLLVWSAMDQFNLSPEEMRESFLTAVLLIAAIVTLGATAAGLWIGLRALLKYLSRK